MIDMFFRLNSDVIINTNYITAIQPYSGRITNSKGNPAKYTVYMADGRQWLMTEEDYKRLSSKV